MANTRVTREDAIQVFTLTLAYLFDAQIGTLSPIHSLYVKEKWAAVFYVWHREQSFVDEDPIIPPTPVAVCTYKTAAKTWKIDLNSGETLTLLDKGNVWVVVGKRETLQTSNSMAKQKRKRPHAV